MGFAIDAQGAPALAACPDSIVAAANEAFLGGVGTVVAVDGTAPGIVRLLALNPGTWLPHVPDADRDDLLDRLLGTGEGARQAADVSMVPDGLLPGIHALRVSATRTAEGRLLSVRLVAARKGPTGRLGAAA